MTVMRRPYSAARAPDYSLSPRYTRKRRAPRKRGPGCGLPRRRVHGRSGGGGGHGEHRYRGDGPRKRRGRDAGGYRCDGQRQRRRDGHGRDAWRNGRGLSPGVTLADADADADADA